MTEKQAYNLGIALRKSKGNLWEFTKYHKVNGKKNWYNILEKKYGKNGMILIGKFFDTDWF